MKNIWLREREFSPNHRTNQVEFRPISASASEMGSIPPISPKRPKTNESNIRPLFPWKGGYHGVQKSNHVPILNQDSIKRTRTVLQKAIRKDGRSAGAPGSPGGHIAREIAQKMADSKSYSGVVLLQEFKPYQFTENVNKMISFGRFDIEARPKWDPRFQQYPKEVAARELDKRMKKRAKERVLATSDSAILVIMRDILEMYTSKFHIPVSQDAKFQAPDHLNPDEIHVWLRLRIALHKAGEGTTHRQLEALANICRQYRADWSQRNLSSSLPHKHARVKIPPILIHFMRYLNLILGGSSSFRSAQFILLRDLNYLLKLIQNIDPLKLPLENLRNATTFRLKDMKRLSLANIPAACTSTDYNITTPNDSPNNSSLSLPPSPIKTQKRTPTPSVASGTTLHTSRTADSVNSFGYNEAAMNSLLESISSWIFSFSLLAKIVLVSAERTPVTLLLKQKNSSPNKSLLVKKKATRVADCKTADALFISDRPSTPERDLTRQNSRRGSLSSILGPPSPSASHRDSVSSGNPFEDTLSLSRHSSFAEEELYPLDVESINRLRSELNAPRTPPAQFGELARGDSRSYGDLENLLLSRLESYAEFNYVEEFNGSYDTQESSTEYTFEQDDPFNMSSEHSEPLHGGQDHHHGMELLIQEKKFRLNPEGELLVEENGEFVRASKNLSLYYDMITDKELNILQGTFQSSPFLSRSAPSSSSILQLSNSYHQHPPTHGMAMDPFHQSKLTAVDILSPNRIHYTSHASNERVIFEDNEKKVKEELLEKHHEFVDTLCRITELKSHNNSILSKERNIPRKYRKKTGEETPNHSHVTNPYHEAFGRVFDEYLD